MAVDDKVVIGVSHATDDPESVLIGYLMAIEALRKNKEVVMWLTKDGVHLATSGYAASIDVPGAPAVVDLHKEYIERGGRFFACPVCVKTHNLQDAEWVENAEVKGAPSVYEFCEGGALTFNY